LLVASAPLLAHAADPSQQNAPSAVLSDQQIEEALHPPATRSLTLRGLTRRDAAAQSVSLNIQFEHNSSALQPQAAVQLDQLLRALTSPSLRKDRFQVAGHTDAKGARQFNKRLSLRRAEAVKDFLVAKGMDAERLDTVGYGAERLLAPDRPEDPRNRRVEIRDLGEAPH
jgi:outer membrane protein OmpA-like peptidoglycan-associated protein